MKDNKFVINLPKKYCDEFGKSCFFIDEPTATCKLYNLMLMQYGGMLIRSPHCIKTEVIINDT